MVSSTHKLLLSAAVLFSLGLGIFSDAQAQSQDTKTLQGQSSAQAVNNQSPSKQSIKVESWVGEGTPGYNVLSEAITSEDGQCTLAKIFVQQIFFLRGESYLVFTGHIPASVKRNDYTSVSSFAQANRLPVVTFEKEGKEVSLPADAAYAFRNHSPDFYEKTYGVSMDLRKLAWFKVTFFYLDKNGQTTSFTTPRISLESKR